MLHSHSIKRILISWDASRISPQEVIHTFSLMYDYDSNAILIEPLKTRQVEKYLKPTINVMTQQHTGTKIIHS